MVHEFLSFVLRRMRRVAQGAVLVVGLGGPAGADVALLTESKVFQSRHGLLQVVAGGFEERLFVWPTVAVTDRYIDIQGVFSPSDGPHDWAVVARMHGGNMCGVSTVLMRIEAGRVAVSGPLGECLGQITGLRFLPGAIEIDKDHPDIRISHVTYRYDGVLVTETEVPATLAPASPTAQVRPQDLIGVQASRALAIPAFQSRLLAIMSPAALEDLRRDMVVSGETEAREGWIFGAGCRAHQCNANRAIWGFRVADGVVVAALVPYGGAPATFGPASAVNSPAFSRALDAVWR